MKARHVSKTELVESAYDLFTHIRSEVNTLFFPYDFVFFFGARSNKEPKEERKNLAFVSQ